MKQLIKLFPIACGVILLSACGSEPKKTDPSTFPDTAANPAKSMIAVLNSEDPVLIDSSENVMYPLVNNTVDDDGGGSFSSGRSKTYWNIIFYNTATKKYHLLDTGRKMIINNYNTSYAAREYEYADSYSSDYTGPASLNVIKQGSYIFYSIIVDDFDKNGVLDSADPEYLFISDKDGNNFKQISPANANVNSWVLIEKTGKVLMQTVTDTNNDKKFTDETIVVSYVYDLKGGVTNRVFDPQFSKMVNNLHQKLWPVKKK